jgi:DNA-binding transcriptional ArsR family regulator
MGNTTEGGLVDVLHVEDARVLATLAHPTRHSLWVALGDGGATTSQLTRRLGVNKGNVAHHLRVLVNVGLVTWGESRTVRGGTEVYAHRCANQLRFAAGTNKAVERAMLTQVADEVLRARNPLVRHRHLRLTVPHARSLREHLDRLATDATSSGPGEREYGLLVSVYDVR